MEDDEITEDELSSAKDVAKLIESDPSLTAKTLKMANSSVYRKTGDVGTRIAASVAKGLTPFVGRKNSMAALMEVYEKARTGQGSSP